VSNDQSIIFTLATPQQPESQIQPQEQQPEGQEQQPQQNVIKSPHLRQLNDEQQAAARAVVQQQEQRAASITVSSQLASLHSFDRVAGSGGHIPTSAGGISAGSATSWTGNGPLWPTTTIITPSQQNSLSTLPSTSATTTGTADVSATHLPTAQPRPRPAALHIPGMVPHPLPAVLTQQAQEAQETPEEREEREVRDAIRKVKER